MGQIMDPNKCLEEIRELITEAYASDSLNERNYCRQQAVELFGELDRWLTQGGFKPDDWNA
jgi:hypothetical protein